MRTMRAFVKRLSAFFSKKQWERELAAELESNLELHAEDNRRAGMNPEEARRAAVLKWGATESVKESYRDRKSIPWLETLAQDVRYAGRTLRKNAGFTMVAVLTLALGIGANTAMFSVVEAVLLRPLPYAQPDRLVEISETNPLKHWTHTVAAPANFADWQRMNTVFTGIAAFGRTETFLSGSGEPQRLRALAVTGNLFDVLGVPPLLGRTFTYEETFEGKNRVAVLSYNLWQSQFAGDPHVVGRTISLTGKTYEVIGVMPRSFFFPGHPIQIYSPWGFKPSIFTAHRRPHYLNVIARLRPNISLDQAATQMTSIARRLEEKYPDTNTKMGVRLDGYHDTLAEEKRPALMMLLAAVGVLFLIVCSNVANLQLSRAASRAREMGIRHALGAGRGRLVRQLLTESLVMSMAGGLTGLVLAFGARAALLRFAPEAIPPFAELRIDGWVILFSIAVTLFAPLLFGVAPALASSRSEMLRDRSETVSRGGRSTRSALVACEVALSVVLVVGAGLLIRSLIRLESVNPGFNPDHAVSFDVLLPEIRYPKAEQVVRVIDGIENGLRKQSNVQAVGMSLALALRGAAWTGDATVEGRSGDDYERELRHNIVTPDYFRAVGTPLERGRFLNEFDTTTSPPVTLVNESLARTYFRGADPIGKRLKFGRPQDKDGWVTVVGVVADQKQDGMAARVQPEVYVPLTQAGADDGIGVTFVIRGTGSPETLIAEARREVRAIDKDVALTDIKPLRDLVHDSVRDQRFRTSLLSGFASIALFLAALGVYGVLAYSVAQRSREIGVRMALGASPARLFKMVMQDGLRPVLAGSIVGLAGAYAATRFIEALLFGVGTVDPPTYLLTTAILGAVATCACAVPAWRAIRVDPVYSLREQ
jgi:putative ABC transport system permease protein